MGKIRGKKKVERGRKRRARGKQDEGDGEETAGDDDDDDAGRKNGARQAKRVPTGAEPVTLGLDELVRR